MEIEFSRFCSIDFVESHPRSLFVFGDNVLQRGVRGQSVVRHCSNSWGIPSKKNDKGALLSDRDYDDNKRMIDECFADLQRRMQSYDKIVFSLYGWDHDVKAGMISAPRTYQYLMEQFDSIFGGVHV